MFRGATIPGIAPPCWSPPARGASGRQSSHGPGGLILLLGSFLMKFFIKLDAGLSLFTCRILGTGSEFPPSRKLGCNVATGSSLFSLGHAWVITVPAGADVN